MLCQINIIELLKFSHISTPYTKGMGLGRNTSAVRLATKDVEVSVASSKVSEEKSSDIDGFGQEWFDDDFGLSRTRREAEELRLQQLQIEQEIQQLQAQQEQVPYYYVREIPNKPPPPYTPPGQASKVITSPEKKPAPTSIEEKSTSVPSSEENISEIVSSVTEVLFSALFEDRDLLCVEPPSGFILESDSASLKAYKQFLFDLSKQLVRDVCNQESEEEEGLPWMRTSHHTLWKRKLRVVPRTLQSLNEIVNRKVMVFFGFKQKVTKENLIIRWSRKKRDHVDELLVRESQEEESEWTNYDRDEITVKNEVTCAILDGLLTDTVNVFAGIFNKKLKKVAGPV